MNPLLKNKFNKYLKTRILNYQGVTSDEIKSIRRNYNLSQKCFAEMLDINLRTLQDYELGRCRPSQTANALFNFVKIEMKTFLKYKAKDANQFVR